MNTREPEAPLYNDAVKIIDTFMFNQDFNALSIRLNELYDVVDIFIVVESNMTHSGLSKPLHLSQNFEIIEEFRDKVLLVSNTKKIVTRNPRVREMFQRKLIDREIRKLNLSPEDFIIHSDCDEIPRANTIRAIRDNPDSANLLLEMKNYSNYLNMSCGLWARARVMRFSEFKSTRHARRDIFLAMALDQKRHKIPLIFIPDFWSTHRLGKYFPIIARRPQMEYVKDAGWHFNNLYSAEEIVTKVRSSSHTELITEALISSDYIMKSLEEGREIYSGKKLQQEEINDYYPEYVLNNLSRFQQFIYRAK